jgi:hypothetical protein
MDGRAGRAAPPRRADVDLRGPCRLVDGLARGRPLRDLARPRRAARALCRAARLHPCRAPADRRASRSAAPGATSPSASSRPPAATAAPRASRISSTAATRRGSASSSTGCPPISRPTATASRASTAPRSTSTPDPREGFHKDWNTLIYNLGRREVSGFLSPPPSNGSSATMSTACAWTRSPRCSTATIPARGGVGPEPVRRPREPRERPVPQAPQRHHPPPRPRRGDDRRGIDRLARRHGRARSMAASASTTSGTWAGCTTRSTTWSATRSTGNTTTT